MNFSVIIPLFNEEDNVKTLLEKTEETLKNITQIEDFEIICVNDDSSDKTLENLKKYKTPHTKILSIKKLGQSGATYAGIQNAKFEILGIMDGDLQNDPKEFEKLLTKLSEGYDMVCGARFERKDSLKKKISTNIARWTRQLILKDNFYDITCPQKVLRKECVEGLTFYNTFHRFIPFLVQMRGFKVVEEGIKHYPRVAGKSKYGIMNRLWVGIKSSFALKWMQANYLDIKVIEEL